MVCATTSRRRRFAVPCRTRNPIAIRKAFPRGKADRRRYKLVTMLMLYHSPAGCGQRTADLATERLPENVVWIDLLRPKPEEVAFVKRTTGLDVPTVANLSEIESSSRLRNENGVLYLSAPLIYRADSNQPLTTPVGFVLTRERLITVRFEELTSFKHLPTETL